MFRADFLCFTSKIVEHSRYLLIESHKAVLNTSMLNLLNHRLVVGLSSASEP